ncbi:Rab3 GTPase-activating protein catalytic subunit-domain-containing protein [Phascolomyces articulosus]|uniref:Rab3 GTPase-activating protein catalytic subunit n=1 Tax=Phascolomyces articulosus TaxID=60185 RepID=A0AAD5PFF8_9FUNG|nr:Rab3 GTPase-activating protein catalytic subunit-domain-containing protein [Phascolomyces articulosus]
MENRAQPKRRQSSTCSEELFEFVDYTSVSNFERLSTAIEEILHSWGSKDGEYGIFSNESLNTANDAISNNSSKNSNIKTSKSSSHSSLIEYYSRREFLSIGEETYKLTYHCHPYAAQRLEDNDHPLAFADYYLLGPSVGDSQQQQQQQQSSGSSDVNNNNYHALHRWTGFDRLFILTPVLDSLKAKLFSPGRPTVDINQAKALISACAIALQNARCTVPIFIPVGSGRHNMYMGYLMQIGEGNGVRDVELRFNTTITYPISSQYTRLDGIRSLFLTKQEMFYEDCGALPLSEQGVHNDFMVAGSFSYTVKNRFDEHWKNLDDWIKEDDLPALPFGSYNDPLRTLTLNAIFPLMTSDTYEDNPIDSNMSLYSAKQWYLTRESAPLSQQRAFLSTLLDQVITSWVRDPTNRDYLSPYDSSNDDTNSNHSNNSRVERDKNGLVRNLFHAMGPNRRGGSKVTPSAQTNSGSSSGTVLQIEQIEYIIQTLFDEQQQHLKLQKSRDEFVMTMHDNKVTKVYTPSALGYRIKRGTPVPYKSFFWNFMLLSLHSLSDPSKLQNGQSCIGFLRMLWMEVVRHIRWHWENLKRIPNVDISLYDQSNSSDDDKTEKFDNSNDYSDVHGIDLRFNILHQKLAMVNCCIQRRLDNGDGSQAVNGNGQQRPYISNLFDDLVAVQKPDSRPRDSTFDKFNSFLEKLVDGDEHRESSPVSLKSEKGEIVDAEEKEEDEDDQSDISDSDMFFDPLEDFDGFTDDTKRPKSSSRKSSNATATVKTTQKSISRSSSLSDVSELAHPHSMTESFVGLNYPSSAESYNTRQSNIKHIDSDQYEIKDPNDFEGRKYQHPSLKLLKTNVPMWIPVTQDAGFMTEDMIRQQADVFEKLGTSESATHIRAKLQSAQLYSDMQAFKAANPHATLEDFVRWHSPRDWVQHKEEQGDENLGRLSARMADPSNIWQELWKCSTRTPASRQKPLFDVIAEGEKALHYLETLSIHEVFAMLLPTIALIAYDTLVNHPAVRCTLGVSRGMSLLGEDITNFPWDYLKNGKCTINPLISSIREQESTMCNAISLLRKFPNQYDLVNRLLKSADIEINRGDEQDVVLNVFQNEQPSSREYILHSNCPNASADGRALPLRVYAMVKDNELRIVDMQSTDAIYQ